MTDRELLEILFNEMKDMRHEFSEVKRNFCETKNMCKQTNGEDGDPTHISEIRFENQSWTGATFTVYYSRKNWSGSSYTDHLDSGNLYLGQSKTITFGKISPDITGTLCPTNDKGIRVESSFNSSTCKQKWILDPQANLRAKYRATGSEFSLHLHFDGTEVVSPPVPQGDGDLKIVNTCNVSTLQGLLQQVIIQENGKDYFSTTWDTHNAESEYHVGLKKGANYSIHMREVYNMAMPSELPAYVYINAFINISNCQAHDGILTLIGTGAPTGKEDYMFDYNGKHYNYTATLNIQDS